MKASIKIETETQSTRCMWPKNYNEKESIFVVIVFTLIRLEHVKSNGNFMILLLMNYDLLLLALGEEKKGVLKIKCQHQYLTKLVFYI